MKYHIQNIEYKYEIGNIKYDISYIEYEMCDDISN